MTGTSEARARLVDGEEQLVEVGERLEDDQVDAALEQAVDLLAEGRPGGRLGDGRPAAGRRPERPDRTADQRVAPADLARLAGELRRAAVELADLPLEAPGAPGAAGWRRTTASRSARRPPPGTRDGPPRPSPAGVDDELLEAGPLRHAAAEQEGAHARRRRAAGARRDGSGSAGVASRRASGRSSVPYRTDGRAAGPEMTRPFLLGRVSKGVPLSCRRTCPDLAPCRLDAGRLSWLQRAGPSATLDKNLFSCGAHGAPPSRDEQDGRDAQAADLTRNRSR